MRRHDGLRPSPNPLFILFAPFWLLAGCGEPDDLSARPQHTVPYLPAVDSGSILTSPQLPTHSGCGFVAKSPDGQHLAITANHLVTTLSPSETNATRIEIQGTGSLGAAAIAGDVAAFRWHQGSPTAIPLATTEIRRQALWLATRPLDVGSGGGKVAVELLPVEWKAERKGLLYYEISRAAAQRLDVLGAPLLDATGHAVGIHLGAARDRDGGHFGIANPVSRFLPQLLAAIETPPGTKIAASPEVEPSEIPPKD